MDNSKKAMSQDHGKEVNIKDLLLIFQRAYFYLLSKWILILLVGFLGAVLGLAYSYYKKSVYTATTTFVLENGDSGSSLGQYAGIASSLGIDLGAGGGGIFQGDNILELYKSRTMLEKALLTSVEINGKKQLLIDRFIQSNHLKEQWDKKPELRNLNFNSTQKFSRVQDSVITDISNELNKAYLSVLKPDKKLSIIRVDVKGTDEIFAKLFNDQIVKTVNDFYVQTKTKKSIENIAILQLKADSVRRKMNANIYSAAIIADETPNLNPTRQQQRVVPIQKSQISSETNRAILSELVKNLELSKMSLLKETPLIQVVDVPIYPLEIQRLGKAKAIIVGGVLFGFLAIMVLLMKKAFTELVS